MEDLPEFTLVLAYDSQYTRKQCDVDVATVLPQRNRTVVALCRRLLREAASLGIRVVWVKVRGHSRAPSSDPTVKGNCHADTAADEGQKGWTKGELEIATYMQNELNT